MDVWVNGRWATIDVAARARGPHSALVFSLSRVSLAGSPSSPDGQWLAVVLRPSAGGGGRGRGGQAAVLPPIISGVEVYEMVFSTTANARQQGKCTGWTGKDIKTMCAFLCMHICACVRAYVRVCMCTQAARKTVKYVDSWCASEFPAFCLSLVPPPACTLSPFPISYTCLICFRHHHPH